MMKVSKILSFSLLLVIASKILISISVAEEEPPWAKAEAWVFERVSKGKVANLLERFKGKSETYRQLRAEEFLEKLLTNSLEGVKVGRHGVKIIGAIIHKPLNLENTDIRHEIWLDDCRFYDKVEFALSNFAKSLSLNGSVFMKRARFPDMKVEGNLHLNGAIFKGPVLFNGAIVSGQFQADSAQFLYKPWSNSDDNNKSAIFAKMRVQGDMFFGKAIFEGPADFATVTVGGDVYFHEAKLEGSLDFNGSKIGGQLLANNTQFLSEKPEESVLDFRGMRVGDSVVFLNTTFESPLLMSDSVMLDVWIENSEEKPFQLSKLRLSRTLINRDLLIKNGHLKDLTAYSLKVNGFTRLDNLTIENRADIENSNFMTLHLSEVIWPQKKGSIQLDAISYRNISAGHENDSWLKLVTLINRAEYSGNAYETLEAFFIRQGYRNRADRVFIERKWRERKGISKGFWSWPSKFKNLFLWAVVGYGRRPWLALLWSTVLIAFGSYMFWQEKGMVRKNSEHFGIHYNPVWYSLDLFVPLVDLQTAKYWMPKQNRGFARNYIRLHTILGWLLIPIGVAAWTGIIR